MLFDIYEVIKAQKTVNNLRVIKQCWMAGLHREITEPKTTGFNALVHGAYCNLALDILNAAI